MKSGDTFKVMVKVLEASAEQPAPSVLVANNVCPSDDSWMYKYDFTATKTEFTFDLKGPCGAFSAAFDALNHSANFVAHQMTTLFSLVALRRAPSSTSMGALRRPRRAPPCWW